MGVILIYVGTGHACMWNFPPFFRRAYPLSHSFLSGTVCGLVWWPSATEERARPSSLLSFSPYFLCFHGLRWDDNRHTRGTCLSTICCCCCLPNPDSKRNRLRIAVRRERPYWNAGVNRGDVCHPYMCMLLLCMVWCIEMDVWVSLDSPWIHRCVHMYMCIPLTASIITVASKCSAKFPREKSSNSPSQGIFQRLGFNDWGGRGCDDFVPEEVTKTAPSGDETTWCRKIYRIWPGGWSNMSPVGAIFVPFPPKTGTNMLHPRPLQSLNWSMLRGNFEIPW